MSLLLLTCSPLLANQLCPDLQDTTQFDPQSHDQCASLWSDVSQPSDTQGNPEPLDAYEAQLGQFFNLNCHRDPELKNANGTGWGRDKDVRDTGPFVAHRDENNEWQGEYHGFHSPVVIWYSPAMMEWLQRNRPPGGVSSSAQVEPIPDGVIIAKEMYSQPASRCRGLDISKMKPSHGIAYMIRDQKAAHDGWFWGYFGHFIKGDKDPNIDWPPRANNPAPYAGFGQYCVNCHASAADNFTFSDLANIKGQPGEPLTYLSQDWFIAEFESDKPVHAPSPALNDPVAKRTYTTTEFHNRFQLPPEDTPESVESITLPSQSYDNVWVRPGDSTPPLSSEYVTSDQCAGCHDAGSTGLSFDMTMPNPHNDKLFNLSPYATWRSSPMGLAGRDPVFYAQLASEEALHSESLDLIWDTCFGCHGIMGQRQFKLDKNLEHTTADKECKETPAFSPDIVTAIPFSGAQTADKSAPHYDLDQARYGALARDGISCVACHRAILTPEQTTLYGDQAQNDCVKVRQNTLNASPLMGDLTGFSKTFTGSFLVSGPGTLFGPYDNPKTVPMQHALNNIPEHAPSIASSEQCGTCHTVHLPVLWAPRGKSPTVIANTYEQTTYPEWLFSAFRTGSAAFLPTGEQLPSGAGETPRSCADCHMESHSDDGKPFTSKIASIQERSNMPAAAYALGTEDIDLPTRNGYARHTLVGLNLFLIEMAQQFNDILGIPLQDPMLGAKGVNGLERTEAMMVDNARHRTAEIKVETISIEDKTLNVDVHIKNLVGHKFPSGVSFRRAFIEFEVLNQAENTLWHSGNTDGVGVLIDNSGKPLHGELWYGSNCQKIVDQHSYQPHYQIINKPEQVQIYQEVKLDPGNPDKVTGTTPSCEEGAQIEVSANLTTSFLSICHTAKDNRLLPAGQLPFASRVAIAESLGMTNNNQAEKLAIETGSVGVGNDPDYVSGGGDTITYQIPLADMPSAPAAVRATLHYQATPPFFLQDRFCNGKGANRDRLFYIASGLQTQDTPIEDWKFELVSTGKILIEQQIVGTDE